MGEGGGGGVQGCVVGAVDLVDLWLLLWNSNGCGIFEGPVEDG